MAKVSSLLIVNSLLGYVWYYVFTVINCWNNNSLHSHRNSSCKSLQHFSINNNLLYSLYIKIALVFPDGCCLLHLHYHFHSVLSIGKVDWREEHQKDTKNVICRLINCIFHFSWGYPVFREVTRCTISHYLFIPTNMSQLWACWAFRNIVTRKTSAWFIADAGDN